MVCPVVLFFGFIGFVMAATALRILFKLFSLSAVILREVRQKTHLRHQGESDRLSVMPSTGPLHTPRSPVK